MSTVPAKSVLNSIKDLQTDVEQLWARVLEEAQKETPGSNADLVARLETLEAIIWGKE